MAINPNTLRDKIGDSLGSAEAQLRHLRGHLGKYLTDDTKIKVTEAIESLSKIEETVSGLTFIGVSDGN